MYNEFYGFSKAPFNLTPDPKFLFVTRELQEAIASLVYGIHERKGFISISGEVGTGKTTLLIYLLTVLDSKTKAVFICQTQITFEELLKEILIDLNLPLEDESKSYMTRQLNSYLKQTLDRGENVAILIDEAQNLSKEVLEELRMLSNLETSEAKLLQIVLVGQPELENKLNSPDLRQLRQRISIRRKLHPITEEDSRQYIEHRLNRVGSSSAAVFSPEALSLICKHSEGIFRNINVIGDNALLIGYGLQKKRIGAAAVREVLGDMGISLPQVPSGPKITYSPKPILQKSSEEFLLADQGERIPARRSLFRGVLFLLLAIVGLAVVFFFGLEYFRGFFETPMHKASMNPAIMAEKVAPVGSEIKTESPQNVPPKPVSDEKRTAPGFGSLAPSSPVGAPARDHEQKLAAPGPTRPEPPSSPPRDINTAGSKPREIIEVAKGETLSSISQRYYKRANMTLIDHIRESNPKINNINRIQISQKIRIPEIKEESFLIGSSGGGYKIHLGTFDNPKIPVSYRKESSLRGKDIEVLPRNVSPGETWYRLVAGKFQTREEALKTLQELREKGLIPIP